MNNIKANSLLSHFGEYENTCQGQFYGFEETGVIRLLSCFLVVFSQALRIPLAQLPLAQPPCTTPPLHNPLAQLLPCTNPIAQLLPCTTWTMFLTVGL